MHLFTRIYKRKFPGLLLQFHNETAPIQVLIQYILFESFTTPWPKKKNNYLKKYHVVFLFGKCYMRNTICAVVGPMCF